MKLLAAIGLGILLLLQPVLAAAGEPGEQVRQTVDNLLATLKDPGLAGESNKNERRQQLKQLINQRFDFTEMAKRSLGPEWRRRSPAQQKEFVQLFGDLLERTYLDQIESYSREKVRYLDQRADGPYAKVATKIVDSKGQEYSVDYRLHNVNGDWKVYDVVIEDVSLVNNYRAQFSRVLTKSSFEELLDAMKQSSEAATPRTT
jgi:phospholipid transport system substrate-binding protein